jgi:hypothetical protein
MVVQGRDVRMDGRSPFRWQIPKAAAVGWGEPFRDAFLQIAALKPLTAKGREENPKSAQAKAVTCLQPWRPFLANFAVKAFLPGSHQLPSSLKRKPATLAGLWRTQSNPM